MKRLTDADIEEMAGAGDIAIPGAVGKDIKKLETDVRKSLKINRLRRPAPNSR